MAAISLITRDETLHQLARRSNWAGENAGVMLVFCILFVIAVGLAALVIYRWCLARKAKRTTG
ncbi:hypothetical protein FQN55_007151 [Onygenales sp. PD_40]|nr:hypothetical protein FQN55_007151 [Onygenales sp. PD_40]KAK2782531.1 hypothetical protein FQN52_000860 [Onygenales sp. PD_12]KAK2807802.1 hypothetical protein FQN50_005345 [Emmonsiellopsis sp. PD_5]